RPGAGATDQGLDLLDAGVVREVPDVEGSIRRAGRTGRIARAAARGAGAAIAPGRLGLKRANRDGFAALERAIERLARRVRLLARREGDESEPARPSGRAVLGKAHFDDVAARRFEELSENVFRDRVWQSCNEQLPRIFSHRKPCTP